MYALPSTALLDFFTDNDTTPTKLFCFGLCCWLGCGNKVEFYSTQYNWSLSSPEPNRKVQLITNMMTNFDNTI
jgi:hypothetical protein